MSDEKKDVVPSQYRDKYKSTGGTCGDFIATALSKVADDGVEALTSVKVENGIERDRWGTMNPGMQRMNLANTLRARFLNGETVTILGKAYNAKHLSEDYKGKIEDTPGALGRLAEYLELQNNERTLKALSKTFFPVVKPVKEPKPPKEPKPKAVKNGAAAG